MPHCIICLHVYGSHKQVISFCTLAAQYLPEHHATNSECCYILIFICPLKGYNHPITDQANFQYGIASDIMEIHIFEEINEY